MDEIIPHWAPKVLLRNLAGVPDNYQHSFKFSNSVLHKGKPWITEEDYRNYWLRLLTRPDMKFVYERVRELKVGFEDMWVLGWHLNVTESKDPRHEFLNNFTEMVEAGDEGGYFFFEEMITSALFVRYKNEVMTDSERDEWLREVMNTAHKLANLIEYSHLDKQIYDHELLLQSMLPKLAAEETHQNIDATTQHMEKFAKYFPAMPPSKKIKQFREQVEMNDLRDERNKRPNDENYRRTYFIRKLSNLFEAYCGGRQVKLVTIITNTIFDSGLSERQVRKTLRTLV